MPKQTGLFQALFCSMKIDFDVPRSNPGIFLGARPRGRIYDMIGDGSLGIILTLSKVSQHFETLK